MKQANGRRVAAAMSILVAAFALAACASLSGSSGWTLLVDGAKGMDNFYPIGDANWRCRIVRDALAADRLPRMQTFASAVSFRGDDEGLNYAFSRTVCRFLQDKGLLSHFYRKLRTDVANDPTGLDTLQAVLGVESPAAIDTAIRNWLLLGPAPSTQR